MRTDDLIADLSSRVTPVRPLARPGVRAAGWSTMALACAAVGIAVFGARPDIGERAGDAMFLWIALCALATTVIAGTAALVLAIPGAGRSGVARATVVALVAIWCATLIAGVWSGGHGLAGASYWYVCGACVVAIGAVPAWVLVGMIRRSAPMEREWTSGLAIAAASAAGALAIQFVCPLDDSGHALLGHWAPVVVMAGAAVAMRRRLLNW